MIVDSTSLYSQFRQIFCRREIWASFFRSAAVQDSLSCRECRPPFLPRVRRWRWRRGRKQPPGRRRRGPRRPPRFSLLTFSLWRSQCAPLAPCVCADRPIAIVRSDAIVAECVVGECMGARGRRHAQVHTWRLWRGMPSLLGYTERLWQGRCMPLTWRRFVARAVWTVTTHSS